MDRLRHFTAASNPVAIIPRSNIPNFSADGRLSERINTGGGFTDIVELTKQLPPVPGTTKGNQSEENKGFSTTNAYVMQRTHRHPALAANFQNMAAHAAANAAQYNDKIECLRRHMGVAGSPAASTTSARGLEGMHPAQDEPAVRGNNEAQGSTRASKKVVGFTGHQSAIGKKETHTSEGSTRSTASQGPHSPAAERVGAANKAAPKKGVGFTGHQSAIGKKEAHTSEGSTRSTASQGPHSPAAERVGAANKAASKKAVARPATQSHNDDSPGGKGKQTVSKAAGNAGLSKPSALTHERGKPKSSTTHHAPKIRTQGFTASSPQNRGKQRATGKQTTLPSKTIVANSTLTPSPLTQDNELPQK